MRPPGRSRGRRAGGRGADTGRELEPAELIVFLIPRMPHFAVPRYVRGLDALPKTPRLKVQKHLISTEGVTEGTFDREVAGIVVKREALGQG